MFENLGTSDFGDNPEKQGVLIHSEENEGGINPEVIMELSGAWKELHAKLETMTPVQKMENLNETLDELIRIARTYITHVNGGTFPTGVYTTTRDMLAHLEGDDESTLFNGLTKTYDEILSLLGKKK
jgi:hypothetical protein